MTKLQARQRKERKAAANRASDEIFVLIESGDWEQAIERITVEPNLVFARRRQWNQTPLLYVCGNSNSYDEQSELTQLILDSGADVNARNDEGDTPLHWLANWGMSESLYQLLDAGANLEAKNNMGRTPLFNAVIEGDGDDGHLGHQAMLMNA